MSKVHHVELPGDIRIECQEAGSGPRPFVLVHGYTGSRDDWREHMPPLAELGRTLALDQRGHGGSSNSGDPTGYTLDQLSADLAATLRECDADPCDLLGHSMGGMVALRYVLAHPERVDSLILMDTAASAPGAPGPARQMMEGVGQLARTSGMAGVAEAIRSTMEGGGGLGARPVAAADAFDTSFERVRPKLDQMDPEAFATLGKALFDQEPVVDRLSEIRCPTTVIVGEADAPLLPGSQVLADKIAGAQLVIVPEAAHQPQLENPRAWFEAVEDHLRRARGTA
ncbi:MAG: alpha/beta hydrolase [Myxococcota bacterium]|nr:alpha/beta hydrolase [Myxococcota bacterium]